MTLSPRNVRLLALCVWAGFLAWLAGSDKIPRYLGPRTAWIVPVGALAVALAVVVYARSSSGAEAARRPLSVHDGLGLATLVAPVLVAVVMSNATLGSLAAANKPSSRGMDVSRLAGALGHDGKRASLLLIRGASEDPHLARRRGIVPGRPVRLTGFVSRARRGGGPLRLARFYITCCVADSVAIDVPVYPAGDADPARDSWVRASGVLARRGGDSSSSGRS